MKFSKKFTNKLVSYVDRYFTWDKRQLQREGDNTFSFDLIAHNRDTKTSVYLSRTEFGIYVVISKNRKDIKRGFLKTYKEVDAFKKMVRCLG